MVVATKKCTHHWMIDTLPTDGFYRARCRVCGKRREFLFIPNDYIMMLEALQLRRRVGRPRREVSYGNTYRTWEPEPPRQGGWLAGKAALVSVPEVR